MRRYGVTHDSPESPDEEPSVADATPVPPSRQLDVPAAEPEEPAEVAPPEDVVVADVPLIVTPVMKGGAPMLGSIALVVNVAGLFV